MASLVDTSVKHFLSTMYGAPVQAGQVGSKIAVLDACLVTGFGLRAATRITVAAGVATVEFTAGSALPPPPDSVLLIDGAAQVLLNGEQRVTESASGVFKFRTAAPDSVDNGTGITFKFAALGWAKPFSGTNQAVYRSTDPQSYGMYLYVDDRDTRTTAMRGYESMSAIDVGQGPFPTAAQQAVGLYWGKSIVASSAAVRWCLVGDTRFFLENVAPGSSSSTAATAGGSRAFGDLLALRRAGDAFATVLMGATSLVDGYSTPNMGALEQNTTNARIYLPRAITGLGGAVISRYSSFIGPSSSGSDSFFGNFPSDVDGELKLTRTFVDNAPVSISVPRALIPGFRYVPQANTAPYFERDTYLLEEGTGRRLLALPHSNSASAPLGYGFVDIAGPWR
ncbi:hypothetical protein [Delftia tsuruhatensis]|uniref:hypothetical protein n=1 Tax=Delftia tsuruhatensis TaxID=180282 RepID=UPI0023D9C915|nr:hypothetical protein [Delftia tsuruhatensis]WEM01033.1 hypothetical protein PW274_12345 [Delftia tsuruhatensis]